MDKTSSIINECVNSDKIVLLLEYYYVGDSRLDHVAKQRRICCAEKLTAQPVANIQA